MSETNHDTREVIAVAGAGDLGRYACEELLKSSSFVPVVLSRGTKQDKWFGKYPDLSVHKTDYSVDSLLPILDSTGATTLISFINDNASDPAAFVTTHTALLDACARSRSCKRFIPSEWIGDLETYPLKPAFYASTREPVRRALRAQTGVEWTLFNVGWLADDFLPAGKSLMTPAKGLFPVDVDEWKACVRGSGDEVQSWTAARDVGRAVVELCKAKTWEQVTYVAGEWNTTNNAIEIVESFYGRPPMPRTHKSRDEIQDSIAKYTANDDSAALQLAQIEEMMVIGCLKCPEEKTMRQRREFFGEIKFMDLKQFLELAEKEDIV